MPGNYTRIDCPLRDCMHYHVDPADPRAVYCKHPHKAAHLYDQPCPLYRLDLMKKASQNPALMQGYQGKRRYR